ncbi:hypothetical protein [Sorangium sp. So ce1024]|uniref:hypothetical protein n=1 Tax=unclassified Sorangium TaxID=2621164 RepID=UPI003F01162B
MKTTTLRWRKFSPIDRDFPIYELVDGDTIVLDLTRDEDGNFEVAFHDGARGRSLDLATLERLLEEAKNFLLREEAD